jgi:hypothetical protein
MEDKRMADAEKPSVVIEVTMLPDPEDATKFIARANLGFYKEVSVDEKELLVRVLSEYVDKLADEVLEERFGFIRVDMPEAVKA